MISPVWKKDTKIEYLQCIDHIVETQLPDIENEPKLYQLVKTYKINSYSKSCRKHKNVDCPYSFGLFQTEKTIIAEGLQDYMIKDES